MRTGQKKLLDKAKKICSDDEMEILMREDLSLRRLDIIFNYIRSMKHNFSVSSSEIIAEINRCLDMRKLVSSDAVFDNTLRFLLFSGYDYLFENKKKSLLCVEPFSSNLYISYCCFSIGIKPIIVKNILLDIKNIDSTDQEKALSLKCQLLSFINCMFLSFYKKEEMFSHFPLLITELNNDFEHSFFKFLLYNDCDISHYLTAYENGLIESNKDSFSIRLSLIDIIQNIFGSEKYENIEYDNNELIEDGISLIEKHPDIQLKLTGAKRTNFQLQTSFLYCNIEICQSNSLILSKDKYGDHNISIYTSNNSDKYYHIAITHNGRILEKINGKFIPMSLKKIFYCMSISSCFVRVMDLVKKYAISVNPFFRDIFDDCKDISILPITFNDIYNYHSRKELLLKRYKKASSIHLKWNKLNINLSYLIIKASAYMDSEKSYNILLQQRDPQLYLYDLFLNKGKNISSRFCVKLFITEILKQRIYSFYQEDLPSEESVFINIRDYVDHCFNFHTKICLHIKSYRHLVNLHKKQMDEAYYANTPKVYVPKLSEFNNLRKILPAEFEWIKTRNRLIEESRQLHHCVYQYANFINNDSCAIYSYFDSTGEMSDDNIPKRYTIEFRCVSGKYIVEQTQGAYNAVNTSKLSRYIRTFL